VRYLVRTVSSDGSTYEAHEYDGSVVREALRVVEHTPQFERMQYDLTVKVSGCNEARWVLTALMDKEEQEHAV
jgi:hypothetical protein